MGCSVPSCTEAGRETPLRLKVAAALAFPDGSMSASGLRREAARGRLVIERIAGKARIVVIEIEVERLLFGGKRRHPKTLVVEFLDDEHRPRKLLRATVLFAT
jgi:hypothetical protein